MEDKNSRWISILVAAEIHKELIIIALDKGISLGELTKSIVANFAKEQSNDNHKQS